MKKQISILALAGVAFLLFNSYTKGAPAKVTGSPGDSNFNCTQSGCHDDGTAKQMVDMISTDIPATGWEAGKTYNVTFTISEMGVSKFGFQVTAEDSKNNKVGDFNATGNTKLVNASKAITHIRSSVSGSGTKSWTFPWIAPSIGTGTVTFYGAGNAADGKSNRTNDIIKLTSHSVEEKSLTSSVSNASVLAQILVFPNPALSTLNVNGVKTGSYKIYDLAGLTHMQGEFVNGENELDVSSLHSGVYFLYSAKSELNQKIIKQ